MDNFRKILEKKEEPKHYAITVAFLEVFDTQDRKEILGLAKKSQLDIIKDADHFILMAQVYEGTQQEIIEEREDVLGEVLKHTDSYLDVWNITDDTELGTFFARSFIWMSNDRKLTYNNRSLKKLGII